MRVKVNNTIFSVTKVQRLDHLRIRFWLIGSSNNYTNFIIDSDYVDDIMDKMLTKGYVDLNKDKMWLSNFTWLN